MFTLPLLLLAQSNPVTGGTFEVHFEFHGAGYFEEFGSTFARIGDINGDGVSDIAIGAPSADSHLQDSGAVYVYSGADQSLLWEKLGDVPKERFGFSVAGPGDVNGDGIPDVVVSSPLTDRNGMTDQGSVWIYSGSDFTQLYRLDGTRDMLQFGTSVHATGDVNADGFADFAATQYEGRYATGDQTVYIFSGNDGALIHSLQDYSTSDFGDDIARAGDLNGDGFEDILIGAPTLQVGGSNTGGAYIYSGANGDVLMELHGDQAFSRFGDSVAMVGDLDHDGTSDFLVGAPFFSTGNGVYIHQGAAYVYSGATGLMIHQMRGITPYGYLGKQVSGGSDFNADGIPDLIIAVPDPMAQPFHFCFFNGSTGKLMFKHDFPPSTLGEIDDWNLDGQPDLLIASNNHFPGQVSVVGINPHFETPTKEISALDGGILMFRMQFPAECAGYSYKILASGSGVGPYRGTVDIPLSIDGFTSMAYDGIYPGTDHFRLHGQLDDNAYETAGMSFPHGVSSAFVGRTFWFACVAKDPSNQQSAYSSVALPVLITP